MLTIFAIPKPFEGHIGVIQRNAIQSWTRLLPRPRILVLGDERGTADVAREFSLIHVPRCARNEYGTPLISDIFARGEAHADSGMLCYVNSDIILMSDFTEAVRKCADYKRPFLLGARRWDVDVQSLLPFGPGWEDELRQFVTAEGRLDPPGSIDIFLFPKKFWGRIPPFAIGRFYWDNWLLYESTRKGALIDATGQVMLVHQRHGYNQTSLGAGAVQQADGTATLRLGPESVRNLAMAGGERCLYNLDDATHLLTPHGPVRRRLGPHNVVRWQITWNVRSRQALRVLEEASRPTSYLGYPARVLLGLIKAAAPARQALGRGLVRLRDRGKCREGETT